MRSKPSSATSDSPARPARGLRARQGALASFLVAARGVGEAWLTGRNMRFHAAAAWGALWLGAWARLDRAELAAVALAVALVLFAELANTAVEAAVDLVRPDHHPLARAAKDYAAGAVLVAAAGAAVTGLLVFGGHLAELGAAVRAAVASPGPGALVYAVGQVLLLAAWLATFLPAQRRAGPIPAEGDPAGEGGQGG